jgi:hypothetical protein
MMRGQGGLMAGAGEWSFKASVTGKQDDGGGGLWNNAEVEWRRCGSSASTSCGAAVTGGGDGQMGSGGDWCREEDDRDRGPKLSYNGRWVKRKLGWRGMKRKEKRLSGRAARVNEPGQMIWLAAREVWARFKDWKNGLQKYLFE